MSATEQRRAFVTGGTGFVGSHLLDLLLEHGFEVTALVRPTSKAALPAAVHKVVGDMTQAHTYGDALCGQDVVFHLGAEYTLGPVNRPSMYTANVEGTRKVLDAAWQGGAKHILHVSSTAALGETDGLEPGESHCHNGHFRSYYEQTKHIAHGIAQARIAAGAPISIAILGGVFGEGDKSVLAETMRGFARGKLPFQVKTESRFNLCHVRSICEGLLKIVRRGKIGESWILTGKNISMPELFDELARHYVSEVPRALSARHLSPLARVLDMASRTLNMPMPLSAEALQIMDGSTYTYSSEKARTHLHWDSGDFRADLAHYLSSPEMRQD